MSLNYKQGFYQVINKEKYKGNSPPFFRSSWELRVMNYLDLNLNVVAWSSEKYIIPYKLPVEVDGTGKLRRYIVDFYSEMKGSDGSIRKFLVEVKPKSQSEKPADPKNSKKISKSYKNKAMAFMVNNYKWEAAKAYCAKSGFTFLVLTEEHIFNLKV